MAVVWRVIFLLTALIAAGSLVQGQTETVVECYVDNNCLTDASPLFQNNSVCCLGSGTLAFRLEGEELCRRCIVFGWLSNSLTANENDNVTAQVGYIKGAFDARVNLGFRLGRTFENASESDFTLNTPLTEVIQVGFRDTIPKDVSIMINDDSVAQEGVETSLLTLTSTVDLDNVFPNEINFNVFFLNRLQLNIVDADGLNVTFTQGTYTANEIEQQLSVAVRKDKVIANPMTVDILPLTLQEATSLGISLPANLSVDRNGAGLNDFDATPISVTFPADEGLTLIPELLASVNITDDSISEEFQQAFVASLDISEAADPSSVNIAPPSLCVIEDNEVLILQWEQPSYTVMENETGIEVCFNITGADSIEGSAIVTVMTSSVGTPPNSATSGEDYTSISEAIDLSLATDFRVCMTVNIIDDILALEANEQFIVQLDIDILMRSRLVQFGENSETSITIIDDDVLQVEWELSTIVFNETDGDVEVCFLQNTPSAMDVPLVVGIAPKSNNSALRDVDFSIASGDESFILDTTTSGSKLCVPIAIIDDKIALEGEEQFTLFFAGLPNDEAQVGPNSEVCVSILDDDVPVISWDEAEYTIMEGQVEVNVCFTITTGFAETVGFSVETFPKGLPPFAALPERDYITPSFAPEFPPRTEPITGFCLPIAINDDIIALEENEQFLVRLNVEGGPLVLGSVPEACVTILDDDVLTIQWEESNITVPENISEVDVCFRSSASSALSVTVAVGIEPKSDNPGSVGEDFLIPLELQFFLDETSFSERFCVSVPIIDDIAMFERDEQFRVFFESVSNEQVVVGSIDEVCVTIVDNDNQNETTCIINDPLRVKPFVIDTRYKVSAICEHYALLSCNETEIDFTFFVIVDFLADTLENGAVLVHLNGESWVSYENGTTVTNVSADSVTVDEDGNTVFNFTDHNVVLVDGEEQNIIEVGGGLDVTVVHQFAGEDNFFEIRVQRGSSLLETCGLCGTQRGELLQFDGDIANIRNTSSVDDFTQSYVVPASLTQLRPQRRECAVLGNDTVIGDPLYTVPILSNIINDGERSQLCFEVRGRSNAVFNLISDTCVSVNAYYRGMSGRNAINQISVRAVSASNQCYNIHVARDGCIASMSSTSSDLEDFVQIGDRFSSDGISVRRYPDRVRIAVPNCENVQLVMWVTCETRHDLEMIRLDISRGLNLRQTSHGLIGQFWNIEISLEPVSTRLPAFIAKPESYYEVTIKNPNTSRKFLAKRSLHTWDKSEQECLYVGSSQGGRSGEVPKINDPVIQGRYYEYQLDGLFNTSYVYSQFEESRCKSGQ